MASKKPTTARRPRADRAASTVDAKKRAQPPPDWLTFVFWQASEMLALVDLANRVRRAEARTHLGLRFRPPHSANDESLTAPLLDDEGLTDSERHSHRFVSTWDQESIDQTLHADVRHAMLDPDEIVAALSPDEIREARQQLELAVRLWGKAMYERLGPEIQAREFRRLAQRRLHLRDVFDSQTKGAVLDRLAEESGYADARSVRRALRETDAGRSGVLSADERLFHYLPQIPPPSDLARGATPEEDEKRKKASGRKAAKSVRTKIR